MANIYTQCGNCYNVTKTLEGDPEPTSCAVCNAPGKNKKNGATVTSEGNLYRGCDTWPVKVGVTKIYDGTLFDDANEAGFPRPSAVAAYQIAEYES